ncbi:MAG TPA: hypothetical protein VNT56_06370 [Acidimicrobiales bacterium]|nr:hypothetical protein [Acidimicrobiales bacterium]
MSDGARRAVTGALLALALAGFVYAFTLNSSNVDILPTGDAVEALVPPDGSQVLRQSEVGIDLAPEWTGVLQVNGIEIPEDQLRRVDAQNQVFFTPGPGQEIEELPPGRVSLVALIWRPVAGETRADADTVRWSIQVA